MGIGFWGKHGYWNASQNGCQHVKTIPLGKIANVATGGTPVRDTPEYWGGTIPWVGTGEIDFNIIQSHTDCLTQKGLDASAAKLLPKGTLLMAMYGQGATRGKVGILGFDAATNQACAAITPKERLVESEFLFHVLEASYTRIRRLSNVGGQDNLNTTLIREIPIPVLSKAERETVVAAAREWTDGIQKTEALLTALERRKQGLMQQLLTGRRRLKGFKGKWKPVRLDAVLERVTRKNTTGCMTPLTVSAQRGLVEQSSYFAKQIAATDNDHYLLLKRGEFAYNRSASAGYPLGAIKRLDSFDEGIVSTLCLCFRIADDEKTDSDFLVGLIEAGLLNRALRAIAHEGARSHGLLNVTATDFFNMRVDLPSIDEQRAMAEVLRDMDEEIGLRRSQLDELKAQKRALMQKLLSGESRLPEVPTQRKPIRKKGLQPPNTVRKQLSKK